MLLITVIDKNQQTKGVPWCPNDGWDSGLLCHGPGSVPGQGTEIPGDRDPTSCTGWPKKKKSTPSVLQRILLLLEPTLGLKSST